ncbi:MAG: hypothetical protein U5R49_20105 [Deltaproteobacteria bacterium]|nr:hypothetical protein [Deltaproteobacteria bacterium]
MKRTGKWLLWATGVFVLVISLLAVGVLLTPRVISTRWVKNQIENKASTAMKRAVHIQSLDWRWTDGIRIRGLKIDDDPSFSKNPLISVNHTFLKLDLSALLNRRIVLIFKMEGVHAHLIRQRDGRTNLETLPFSEKPAPEHPEKKGPFPFVLPEDVTATIRIRDVKIEIEDRLQGRRLSVQNAQLGVTAPSLQHDPVHLLVSSEQEMDGEPLPSLHLGIRLSDFMTPSWGLDLNTLSLKAEGSLPGFDLSLRAGPGLGEGAAQLGLDLKLLSDAVRPFAPASLPNTEGRMALTVKGIRKDPDNITFNMDMKGTDLKAEGGGLKDIRLMPLTFSMTQEGVLYPNAGRVEIITGKLHLQENTRMAWKGNLKQPQSGPIGVDLTIGPILIDFEEVTRTLKGIMPPDISLAAPASDDPSTKPRVEIARLNLSGEIPGGNSTIELKGLELSLPMIKAVLPTGAFSAEDLRLRIEAADTSISSGIPTRLTLSSRLDMKHIHLKGPMELRLKAVEWDALRLESTRMAPHRKGLVGITGDISIKTKGTLKKLSSPAYGNMPLLSHTFDGHLVLPPSPALLLKKGLLSLALKKPAELKPMGTRLDQDVEMTIQMDHTRLQQTDTVRIDAENITADVDAGTLFKGHVNTRFQNLGFERLETRGTIACDTGRILSLIPSNKRPEPDLSGNIVLDWTFRGRRPNPSEIRHITNPPQPLDARMGQFRFIEDLSILARFNGLALDLPFSEGKRLTVEGVHTPSPLSLKVGEGLKQLDLEGKIACNRIRRIPPLGRLDPAIRLTLGFSLQTKDLKTATISQSLDIQPLNIQQRLSGSIDHLDRLLAETSGPAVGQILATVDAALTAQIKMDLARVLTTVLDGPSATGILSADADLSLTGNKDLTTHLRLNTSGLDAQMNHVTVDHLQSDLEIFRRFNIVSSDQPKIPDTLPLPLSRKVLNPPSAAGFSEPGQAGFNRIPGLPPGPPNVTWDAAVIPAGPVLLNVSNSAVRLDLEKRLPAIDHFQADILGGTITGSLRLSEEPERFMLRMACAFSGLNMDRLSGAFASAASTKETPGTSDTEISGQLVCHLPISEAPGNLLSHLQARIRLTHIGSNTLERFLYALDPYESNEMIVKQRKLLRQGSPRWVAIDIQDGNLSLRGEVAVKGAVVSLPAINRFNISLLPIGDRLNELTPKLKRLTHLLKILAATTILINKDNGVQLTGKEAP